jgi:hypothetical protein
MPIGRGRGIVASMIWVFAHQGGWDEVLLFAGPLVLAFLAIGAFERRGKRQRRAPDKDGEPVEDDGVEQSTLETGRPQSEARSQNSRP